MRSGIVSRYRKKRGRRRERQSVLKAAVRQHAPQLYGLPPAAII